MFRHYGPRFGLLCTPLKATPFALGTVRQDYSPYGELARVLRQWPLRRCGCGFYGRI